MADISRAEEELNWAEQELELMSKTSEENEIKRHWSNFLDHLSKFWKKSLAGCRGAKGFQAIESDVERQKKKDTVLRYLWHARNADSHNTETLTTWAMGSQLAGEATIQHEDADGKIFYSKMPLYEFKYIVRAITDSNEIYTPPTYRNGKLLKNGNDPFVIGRLGLEFYQGVLERIKERVIDQESIR